MEVSNKVVYITGGSKGIGYGIAKLLSEQNMRVAISSRDKKRADFVANYLTEQTGNEVIGIASDVRNEMDEKHAIDTILKKWGQLDVLVANAGVGHFAPIDKMTTKQWNDVIDINLTGVFHSTKASVEALKKSKGYILTIASLAGTNFFPQGAAYNASKFGLVGFTQAIMLDLRNYGIKVSTIMPGSVSTYFNNNQPDDADNWKIQPQDIGQIVLDLLKMPARTLPSKVEVRPSMPPKK